MTNPKENIKNQSASSQPAGEARGSDLPPQEQGGSHLPDISEPTSKSLSEQFESGPDPVEPAEPAHKCFVCNGPDHRACGCEARARIKGDQAGSGPIDRPADPPHKCFVCNGPDHRACGCEARELQKQIEQDDKAFRAQDIIDEELRESDGSRTDQDLAKSFDEYADRLDERIVSILDAISDINSNLETLVSMEKDRANLLKDIRNVGANQA